MFGYPLNILLDPILIDSLNTLRFELGQQLQKQLDLHNNLLQKNSICQHNQKPFESLIVTEMNQKIKIQQKNDCQNINFPRQSLIRRRKIKKQGNSGVKNDTKNIPKNYGKAILSFIQKNSFKVKKLCHLHKVNFAEFMVQVRKQKTKINSIADLRGLWSQDEKDGQMKKCFRVLSYQFMRKHCLMYIFHSRVKNYGTHIKYRGKIIEGIQRPSQFTNIKEY